MLLVCPRGTARHFISPEDFWPTTLLHGPVCPLVYVCACRAQSCPWVGLTDGLVWVGLGRDFSVFGGFGWVGSTIAKVLKIERIMLMHLKHG